MTVKYLQASLDGVPFEFEAGDDAIGARNIIHEFPGRKSIYAEPDGEETPRFTLECHVIGPDYQSKQRRLEDVLRKEGPRKLVHPLRGSVLVSLTEPVRFRWTQGEGGMYRFSLALIESDVSDGPSVRPDTGSVVRAKAAITLEKAKAQRLDVSGPDFLHRAASAILAGPQSVTDSLRRLNDQISADFGLIDDFSTAIDDFKGQVNALLRKPDELALKLRNLVNTILTAIGIGPQAPNAGDTKRNVSRVEAALGYAETLGAFGATLAPVPLLSSTRVRQQINQDAIVDVVELAGVSSTIEALSEIPFDNTDQANETLARIDVLIDAIEVRDSLDDEARQAMLDMRAAFHQHLRAETGSLPALANFTPKQTMPVLLIAWQLFGDATREQEIIDQNDIEHPGFVPGGVAIAVSNA